jgi:hypothetical protein
VDEAGSKSVDGWRYSKTSLSTAAEESLASFLACGAGVAFNLALKIALASVGSWISVM